MNVKSNRPSPFRVRDTKMAGMVKKQEEWLSALKPLRAAPSVSHRPDSVCLGEVAEFWHGAPVTLQPTRPVLIGFPSDLGICRNHGREGAATGPYAIRS